MTDHDPDPRVEEFLDDLDRHLLVGAQRRQRIRAEIRGHLEDSIASNRDNGPDAAGQAVARFGRPAEIARQINAEVATASARRTGVIAPLGGAAVAASFLLGARALSSLSVPDHHRLVVQVAFQVATLAAQVALVAGVRLGVLIGDRWRQPTLDRDDLLLVRNCDRVLTGGLIAAALGWSIALVVRGDTFHNPAITACAISGMTLGAIITAVTLRGRRFGGEVTTDERLPHPSGLWPATRAERLIELAARHRVVSVGAVALASAAAEMTHAETTFLGSIPWGVGEVAAVIAAFLTLRRPLGLDPAGAV